MALAAIPFGVIAAMAACNHEHDDECGYITGISECRHIHDASCGGLLQSGGNLGAGNNQPPGGGGNSGGGGGPGGNQPPATPPEQPPGEPPTPPGKDGPKGIPVEIEPDPDGDSDFKPEKEKMKVLEKDAVWTITFRNAKNTNGVPLTALPQYVNMNFVLNFTATKPSGEAMEGKYTGQGSLSSTCDASRLVAQAQSGRMDILNFIIDLQGPIEKVSFDLGDPDPDLAPLGGPKPVAAGYPSAGWNATAKTFADGIDLDYGDYYSASPMDGREGTFSLKMKIEALAGGMAKLTMGGVNGAAVPPEFTGRVSKKIIWREI